MDVGVRELKAKLSEYLNRAERGEVITVTDRGVPKAVLAPIAGRSRMAEGIAAGWIRPGNPRSRPKRRERSRSKLGTGQVLDEDRGA